MTLPNITFNLDAISCYSKSRLVLPWWFYLSGTGLPG